MTIHKCDRCGKEIDAKFAVTAGRGWSSVELCEGCGKPVALCLARMEKMKDGKKTAHDTRAGLPKA